MDATLLYVVLHLKLFTTLMSKYLPDCIFLKHGILCPSCGGTRCIYSLVKGDITGALKYNFMIFLAVIYIILIIAVLNLQYLFGFKKISVLSKSLTNPKVLIFFALSYGLYGIYRNFI